MSRLDQIERVSKLRVQDVLTTLLDRFGISVTVIKAQKDTYTLVYGAHAKSGDSSTEVTKTIIFGENPFSPSDSFNFGEMIAGVMYDPENEIFTGAQGTIVCTFGLDDIVGCDPW